MRAMLEQEYGAITLGLYDGRTEPPRGCVVVNEADGVEWLVYAPRAVAEMREQCPICAEGREHIGGH
jgi:hypothetical protein